MTTHLHTNTLLPWQHTVTMTTHFSGTTWCLEQHTIGSHRGGWNNNTHCTPCFCTSSSLGSSKLTRWSSSERRDWVLYMFGQAAQRCVPTVRTRVLLCGMWHRVDLSDVSRTNNHNRETVLYSNITRLGAVKTKLAEKLADIQIYYLI